MLPQHRITLLLAAFGRALSHQVRTPLSVISNDLFYLQTLIAPEECQRSLERCKSISDILAAACQLSPAQPRWEVLKLQEMVQQVFGCLVIDSFFIKGDRQQLHQAFLTLSNLLALDNCAGSSVALHQEKDRITLDVIAPNQSLEIENDSQTHTFESFTEAFNLCARQDSLAPMCIDAILWEHAANVRVELQPMSEQVTVRSYISFEAWHE